uniref:Metallothionein n=1 Tax=Gouania willdenowi TaxID=441366 RepID=A0A8C5GH36_GOUWI
MRVMCPAATSCFLCVVNVSLSPQCWRWDCACTCQPPECQSCNCLCFEIRIK